MAAPFSLAPLHRLAEAAFGVGSLEVTEMKGGASLRRFFRVTTPKGSAVAENSAVTENAAVPENSARLSGTAVGMYFPDALTSEEASSDTVTEARWPFLEVRELLASCGVDVPNVLGEDCDAGWLLVEDLGERTLADALLEEPERKTELYQRVIADLARAHAALTPLPTEHVVNRRVFDVPLLEWEIDHFREWGLLGRGVTLSQGQSERYKDLARRFAEKVRALPYAFTHRDFQSRNLMVVRNGSERVVWIDFQDAMLGPRVYDLVALLNDSYQSFTMDFIDARLKEYCAKAGLDDELERITKEFHWVTVQRKLKDAGRFVFIQHKKGDASYLPFVEPTIALVRRSLAALSDDPDARALSAFLDEVLPG